VPFGLAIGAAYLLVALTGGGRVRIERPRSETISSAS